MKSIQFLRVKKHFLLSHYLQIHLQQSLEQAQFLIHWGAIYCNFKRVTHDLLVNEGDILRCHLHPKRYLTLTNWTDSIVFENEAFLIIDKPAGLPCQAGLDNRIENALFLLEQEKQQKLFITHRLDIGTSGLLLIAKTSEFQSYFNRALEQRAVLKIYEALTEGPTLPPQTLTHWMRPQARAPKILSREAVQGWKLCELSLLNSELVQSGPATISGLPRGLNRYKIKLHTGRTHQIRAQLSFEENPILGDKVYGGRPHALPFEWQSLRCVELGFQWAQRDYHWQLSPVSWTDPRMPEITP